MQHAKFRPDTDDEELDEYEQFIEDNFDKVERYPPEIEREKMRMYRQAAENTVKKKDKTITLRINGKDLERLQEIAKHEGLRYQTYLTHMIHKMLWHEAR